MGTRTGTGMGAGADVLGGVLNEATVFYTIHLSDHPPYQHKNGRKMESKG